MEFRILGPLEIFDESRPVSVHRGKEQALLAFLLLHANEPVASERLIDELWGERPPATAPKILQNAVSQLRKALGDGRLVTRPPGYLLRLAPGELDLDRFQQLAREGRAHGDPARLRQALALWRGEPLADLRDERFAQRAALHLEEERLAVLEDRIDADLAAGRHTQLVPELEQLSAEQPLRERPHAQLMLALYRSGRQADALEAYQRARRTLNRELGLQPSPQLQQLERKILQHDPELAAPQPKRQPLTAATQSRRRRLALLALGTTLLLTALTLALIKTLTGTNKPLLAKPNTLAVIDPSRNRVVDVVPVGSIPRGVAVGKNDVWVTNSEDGTLSGIDLSTLKVVDIIGIAAQATDVVEAAGGVWVATGRDNTIVHIDARTGGVVEKLRLSSAVSDSAYAVTAGMGAVWATSGNRLLKIDPHTGAIVARTAGTSCCFGINDVALGENGIWVADISNKVVRISPGRTESNRYTDLGVIPVALAAGYGSVWVAVQDPSGFKAALWRMSPQTVRVTQTIPLGGVRGYPPTLEVAVGEGAVWATNYDAGTLVRIDPTTGAIVSTIHLGGHPWSLGVGAHRVWVTVN